MIGSRDIRRSACSVALVAAVAGCAGAHAETGGSSTTGRALPKTVSPATTQALNLPNVKTAELAACEEDFQTLRTAENTYQLVNDGHYASMGQLLDGQYISGPLTYYVGVKIGIPVHGYTLLAAPDGPCASLPVREPY